MQSPFPRDGRRYAYKPRETRISWRLLLSVLSGTLGASFQFGFSTGFVNNMQAYIRAYFEEIGVVEKDGSPEDFTFMWSIVVSGFAIGGMIGTFLFPVLSDRVGRKTAILSTSVFCYASCYLIAFPSSWTDLILGRVFVGIGAGGACAVVPGYVTEIAPTELRGTLGTVHQLMITIGIVVAQALSTEKFNLFGSPDLWQYTLLVPFASTTFLLITMPFCCESPAYVFKKEGWDAAKDVLWKLRPDHPDKYKTIFRELKAIRNEAQLSPEKATVKDFISDELLWKPLLVGSMVNLSMQFSGIDAVFYYSTNVFLSAGFSMSDAQVCTTMISLANVLVTIPAMFLMDKAGRKVIQIAGLSGMGLEYLLMTVGLVNGLHLVSVVAMFFVICCFAFGPGCVAWFIIPELLPIHARGVATSVALTVNWTANWFIAFIFPRILAYLGPWTFGVFAVSTSLLSVYLFIFLPETKGKTPIEIREVFSSDNLLIKSASDPKFLAAAARPLLGKNKTLGEEPATPSPLGKGKKLFGSSPNLESYIQATLQDGTSPDPFVLPSQKANKNTNGVHILTPSKDGSGDVIVTQREMTDDIE